MEGHSREKHAPGTNALLGETCSRETHAPGRNNTPWRTRSPETHAPGTPKRESPRKFAVPRVRRVLVTVCGIQDVLRSQNWAPPRSRVRKRDRQELGEDISRQVTRPNFRTCSANSGLKLGIIRGGSVKFRLGSCTICLAQGCSGQGQPGSHGSRCLLIGYGASL